MKNKKFKKIYLGAATLMLGAGVLLPSTASAYSSGYYQYSSGHSFKKAWSVADDFYTMKYGYNTAWINEDFVHAYHSGTHEAILENDNGAYSKESKTNTWAKLEVRHAGTKIMYGMLFN
ncbi:mediterrocin family bacteriocin [Priestia megaterium]|uniref:mediterrocin family bacteriocin n=1 Tax=Priestia megaterium TaxID=1404 RepID=UPI0034E2FB17